MRNELAGMGEERGMGEWGKGAWWGKGGMGNGSQTVWYRVLAPSPALAMRAKRLILPVRAAGIETQMPSLAA